MKTIKVKEHFCYLCNISVLKYQVNWQVVKIELMTINFVIDHLSAIINPPHAVEENFVPPSLCVADYCCICKLVANKRNRPTSTI